MTITLQSEQKVCGGRHQRYRHFSDVLNCEMTFAIFLPEALSEVHTLPVLYWLSGLTCTDENFMQKAGAFKTANTLGVILVAPDTSPRGEGVPDDENGAYDLGLGAGFYVNATQAPWRQHYQMYDYVTHELPQLISQNFPVTGAQSIAGHSMGGHGALIVALKNSGQYRSVSAFAPIVSPSQCPWGVNAFSHYLGNNQNDWAEYDATALIEKGTHLPILIDQGTADNFLDEQLNAKAFLSAAKRTGVALDYRLQEGYDHSYYFIASFIDDHLHFHHEYLAASSV